MAKTILVNIGGRDVPFEGVPDAWEAQDALKYLEDNPDQLEVLRNLGSQPAPSKEWTLGSALNSAKDTFMDSLLNQSDQAGKFVMNPEQSIPMMGQLLAGTTQKVGDLFGIQPQPNEPDYRALPEAVGQNYKEAYGGTQNILNTLATDPARMAFDLLPIAQPVGKAMLGKAAAIPGLPAAAKTGIDMVLNPENIPGVAARNIPGMSTMPEYLYRHALAMGSGNIKDSLISQTAKIALDQDLGVGRKGVKSLKAQMRSQGAKITSVIDEAERQGVMIDPIEFVTEIRNQGGKGVTPLSPKGLTADEPFNVLADDFMDFVVNKYGTNGAVPNQIPIKTFYEWRKLSGKRLQGYWDKLNKTPDPKATDEALAAVAGYRTAGRQISSKVPEIIPVNKQYHDTAVAANLMDNIVKKRFKEQFIPSQVTLPLAIEFAGKGHAGIATAIGTGRVFMRQIEDVAARYLYNRMQLRPHIKSKGVRSGLKNTAKGYVGGSYLDSILEQELQKGEQDGR
jgi:hypothetical protein